MYELPDSDNARLALDTIAERPTRGIPTCWKNIMQHGHLERLAGAAAGEYRRDPQGVYVAAQRAMGVCLCDQFIPTNPLTLGDTGYEGGADKSATQGAEQIVIDGMVIDSPEAVVEHLERFVWPAWRRWGEHFNEDDWMRTALDKEVQTQAALGPTILKTGYGLVSFPFMRYYAYGYENYFMAYALYPEVIERDFAVQADYNALTNAAAARLYQEHNLPRICRLDHDMADSRGTLVGIESLDAIWFPHFVRALEPILKTDVRLIWHCDGNLMQMVPRLLDAGIDGFQGFQYEDGMDYAAICRMRTRDGRDPIIMAGVSVTTTLPHGSPDDVRREIDFLVEHGPSRGLFLGCSSSMTPGVPWENVVALVEGLHYYREHGRSAGTNGKECLT